jgi:hypothetical protein
LTFYIATLAQDKHQIRLLIRREIVAPRLTAGIDDEIDGTGVKLAVNGHIRPNGQLHANGSRLGQREI